jgi:hypothetical protein
MQVAQGIVDLGYYAADTICGYIIFGILFLFSIFPVVDSIQGTLLFNSKFVRDARTGQQVKAWKARQAKS